MKYSLIYSGIVSDILSYILAKGLDGLGMATVPGTPEGVY